MQYLLTVKDSGSKNLIVLSLSEKLVDQPAVDAVFAVMGESDPTKLKNEGVLAQGQIEDYKALQKLVFDQDDQGLFIREGIEFKANSKNLDPDSLFIKSFLVAQKENIEYKRCELMVGGTSEPSLHHDEVNQHGQIEVLARLMLLHQVASGYSIDVTKENLDIADLIVWAENENLIEIDVSKAVYKLTEKGVRMHNSYLEEARNLIERYDIYSDVDVDDNGNIHFDTAIGEDLRVAIYEMDGVDPYRARFLLGLNDGEWNTLDDWTEKVLDEKWYQEIFEPIDKAPAAENLGENLLKKILEQGKSFLREKRS